MYVGGFETFDGVIILGFMFQRSLPVLFLLSL